MKKLFIALALLLPFAAMAEEASFNLANTLTVRGEATTKVAPDEVTLPVTISDESTNLTVAKERHDKKLQSLLKLAGDMGIPKEKIQTSYTSVSPQFDNDSDSAGKQRLRDYIVQTGVEFKITDLTKVGEFMSGVVNLGIDQMGSVSYGLQDERKVKEDTAVKALENAGQKAARLAAAGKVSLGGPLVIQEGDAEINRPNPPPFRPMPMMRAMSSVAMAPMQAAPPELPTGLIEVNQSVTVTYSLKP